MFKKLLVLCLSFSFAFLSFETNATNDGCYNYLICNNDNKECLLVRLNQLKNVENNHLRRLARLEEARALLEQSSIKRNQKELQMARFKRIENSIRAWLVQNKNIQNNISNILK